MTTATLTPQRTINGGERNVLLGLLKTRQWEDCSVASHMERGAKLAEDSTLTYDGYEWMVVRLRLLPRRARELNLPRQNGQKKAAPKVEAGHYMVEDRRFYVRIAKTGKWKGFAFLVEQDAHLAETPVRGGERARILALIAADPNAAAAEYGKRTGRCGYCHRALTDPTSVSYGIGPDCRDKHGIA